MELLSKVPLILTDSGVISVSAIKGAEITLSQFTMSETNLFDYIQYDPLH